MEENKNTAQTSGGADGSDTAVGSGAEGTSAVTDKTAGSDNGSAAAFTDGQSSGGENSAPADKGTDNGKDAGKAARERNAEYARRRREAERQKELKDTREKAIIEALGGINPYTEEEMKDSHDVEEFLVMQEIKKNGGDPVADFAKNRKERERKNAETQAEQERQAEWYRNDKAEFATAYPDVDLEELIGNEAFQDYADGKVGVRSLKSIYEGFLRISSDARKEAQASAAQALANSKASPGSLSSSGNSDDGFFTRDQVKAMSQAEVSRNFDKIKESMKRWSLH